MKRFAFLLLFLIPVSITRAQAGPTFFYVGTAVDANGLESVFSIQASCVLTQGKHICTSTWTASVVPAGGAAIAGYNVYRATAAAGPFAKVNTTLITGLTFLDAFVPPNAQSGFSVAAS